MLDLVRLKLLATRAAAQVFLSFLLFFSLPIHSLSLEWGGLTTDAYGKEFKTERCCV
jgi:hypothetical protein